MDLKTAIEQEQHDDVLNEIDKFLLQEPKPVQTDLLMINKLIAYIKMNQSDRAFEYIKNNNEIFQKYPQFNLLKNYVIYQKENYKEILLNIQKLEQYQKSFEIELLQAQCLAKLEKYPEAFDIYEQLLKNQKCQEFELEEELQINLLYVGILLILDKGEELKNMKQYQSLINVVKELFLNYLPKAEQRETFLNYVLLLIVLDQSKIFKMEEIFQNDFEFIKQGEQLIEKIYQDIQQESEMVMENQEGLDFLNFKGEKFDDFLTLFILRTFLMKKQQKIHWNENDINKLVQILLNNPEEIKNQQLRISLLSYLILLNTLSKQPLNDLQLLLQRLNEELDLLKKSKKSLHFVEKLIHLNRAVLFIHMNKCNDANKIIKNTLRNDLDLRHLPLQMTIFIRSKQYKGFHEKVLEFKNKLKNDQNNKQLQCIYYLFQIAFYYHINNQKQYTQSFVDFIQYFFMEQLEMNEEQRFLKPQVFNQFAQNIVFYIQRNQNILNKFQNQIIRFVDYIQDPKSVAKIAEGFVDKKNYQTAEQIYKVLVSRNPDNMLFQSRLNFIYSILAPENINEDILPEFDLITDFNTLNNLESEYLKVLQTSKNTNVIRQQTKEEDQKVKKIKKKNRKIRWPQNFDFENPGPRPDEERWIPRHLRKKNKKGKKKQFQTKTQGGMAQTEKTFDMFTQQHSTAQQKTSGMQQRKRKKKGKR